MQDKQLFLEARHQHNQAAIRKKHLQNTITETLIKNMARE